MTRREAWQGMTVCGLVILGTLYAWKRLWGFQFVYLMLFAGFAYALLTAKAKWSLGPIDTTKSPRWWVRAIWLIVFMTLFAGLEWGKGWWQSRLAAALVGISYTVTGLVLYGRKPDSRIRSRGYYFGYAVVSLTLAAFFFAEFSFGSRSYTGLMAFVCLAAGLRYSNLYRLISQQTSTTSGIESLQLNNHA